MFKNSRFTNIKNEMEKQVHLDKINEKSKKQQTVFNNPFFKQMDDNGEDNENLVDTKLQQLEEIQVHIQKDLNLQIQHKVKSHIIDHKLKNNYDYVRLKYIIRIWREQSVKIKIAEEQVKQQQNKAKENMINDMIKTHKYEQLKQQQEQEKIVEALDDEKSQILELEELVKNKKQSSKTEQVQQAQHQTDSEEQKNNFFKMPDSDLLQYIPFCTDIYLGKD